MPRVKRGPKRIAYRQKTLKASSGYFLTKSKLNRAAQEAVERALKFGYVGLKTYEFGVNLTAKVRITGGH